MAAPSGWLRAAVAVIAAAAATARADDIAADRPGFGEAASVVERGRVQLETGVAWTRVGGTSVLDLPEAVLRVGVGASLEVRVQASDWLRAEAKDATRSGWSDTGVGIRWQAAAGAHELSLRGVLFLPSGTTGWSDGKVDPEGAASWAHELGAGWSASATMSARRFTSVATTDLSPSVSVEHALGSRGSTFLEYGATVAAGHPPLHQLDHGYTWLLNPDTQVDVSVGFGLSSAASAFFVAVGFSRRF
jgi:outer membrane putative beta-barrel porin/alpha-amylase